MRDSDNIAQTIVSAKGRDEDNVLRDIAGGTFGFTAEASPTSSIGYTYSGSSVVVTTATTVAVTVTGGVPPYTYQWDPTEIDWEAIFPTSESTRFRSPPIGPGDDVQAYFACTVTDSTSAVAVSNQVFVRARNNA